MATKHPPPLELPDDDGLTELQRFEQALRKRFPDGRLIQRFEMPSAVKQMAAVYLMEITSKEDLQAAIYADTVMLPIERASVQLSTEAQRREAARASVCGYVTRDASPTYVHVNNGQPWHAVDSWPAKVWSTILTYFGTVNGVSTSELVEGLKGARPIGAAEPPTQNATQAPASTAKRNGG